MAENQKPQLVHPPNPLKSKVGVGGPGAVRPEDLERAEKVIAALGDDYLDWVQDDLTKLQAAFEGLKSAKADNSRELEEIYRIAHDIKGQGGSFDYQLMTGIGDHLCHFLETLDTANPAVIAVIELHVDALRLVIAEKMTGDGGPVGQTLFKGLEEVVAKVRG